MLMKLKFFPLTNSNVNTENIIGQKKNRLVRTKTFISKENYFFIYSFLLALQAGGMSS